MSNIEIFNDHCIAVMLSLKDDTIDLTITSPPYDDLRDYESRIDIRGVSEELLRVTKPGGVCVWIVADSTKKGSETGTSFRQALAFKSAGWLLHDTMIWLKPHFANPSSNRYHQKFEYMFIFAKPGKKPTFNPIKDVPIKYGKPHGKLSLRLRNGEILNTENNISVKNKFAMRGNVWLANTVGQENFGKKVLHPSQFPEGLIREHMQTWSNPGDIVFDPFIGSGTTAVVAKALKRHCIGAEINHKFYKMALGRLSL